jgi:hypothetical protein
VAIVAPNLLYGDIEFDPKFSVTVGRC